MNTPGSRVLSVIGLAVGLVATRSSALAWTFPEHAGITQVGILRLSGQEVTRRPWEEFRAALDQRLPFCPAQNDHDVEMPSKDGAVSCVPIYSLAALAGDHACTPVELYNNLLLIQNRRWVFDVLGVSEETRKALSDKLKSNAEREAVRRQMHVDMQLNDTNYVARALIDYSHFQIPREGPQLETAGLKAYLKRALTPGEEANATASYVNYHVAAIGLALRAQSHSRRSELLTWALITEAFALHFLEDSFSSGHFVGHWGDSSTRLGTHDYYSTEGFQATRWAKPGEMYVAKGDAFLDDKERDTIAEAVESSLYQVVLAGTSPDAARDYAPFAAAATDAMVQLNSCTEAKVLSGLETFATYTKIISLLRDEPVPSARNPEVLRVRAEQGFFFGSPATVQASLVGAEPGWSSRLMAGLRVGYGAAGLVNDPLNAQVFFEGGAVGERLYDQSKSSMTGFSFRMRAPGMLAFDGIFAIPLAVLFKEKCPFCIEWGAAAAGGGPWRFFRSRRLVGRWSWQISAGRDASLNVFRNQPKRGTHRYELLAPVLTVRYFWPMSHGSDWAQSADLYIDIGPSVTFTTGVEEPRYGGFISLSAAPRVFP